MARTSSDGAPSRLPPTRRSSDRASRNGYKAFAFYSAFYSTLFPADLSPHALRSGQVWHRSLLLTPYERQIDAEGNRVYTIDLLEYNEALAKATAEKNALRLLPR